MTTRTVQVEIAGRDVDRLTLDDNGGAILTTRDDCEFRVDETVLDRLAELAARRAA